MTKKIFRNILLVSLTALILAGGLIMVVTYNLFYNEVRQELKQGTAFVAEGLKDAQDQYKYLNTLTTLNIRITWIGSDGTVLFDNMADASAMENHKGRPEVSQALSEGIGQADRYSTTLSEVTLYYAERLEDGSVIRLSQTRQSVWGLFTKILPISVCIIAGTIILCLFLARKTAKRIVRPLNQLDLEEPEKNDVYEELSPLLVRLTQQNNRIGSQIKELARQQQELSAITQNMSEGLVILNKESKMLLVNDSALKLFGKPSGDCTGRSVLELNRSLAFQKVVEEAQKGKAAQRMLGLGGRAYQMFANPVKYNNILSGVIVLILDVTERQEAENIRREFSANVSHELKTPLTSISGYAELMKNGVARPEDVSGFASRIYDEAVRLIALVEDIMKLSQLDEGDPNMNKESIGLLSVARDVSGRLEALAKIKKVSMSVEGEEVTISGVKQIIEEMIFNLCENALKYNRENGSVVITVKREKGHPVLSVSDTGIGIPLAHQTKVFERFYRVDKSHSKETGGTGLGLSIVKHAAQFHNARVTLTSLENEGTRVDIQFSGNDKVEENEQG